LLGSPSPRGRVAIDSKAKGYRVPSHREKTESQPAPIQLLQAFAVTNRLTGAWFQEMENTLLRIALEMAYVSAKRRFPVAGA
jgi:hypothetical protein